MPPRGNFDDIIREVYAAQTDRPQQAYTNAPNFLTQEEADRQKTGMLQQWMGNRPPTHGGAQPLTPEEIDQIRQQMLMRRMAGS